MFTMGLPDDEASAALVTAIRDAVSGVVVKYDRAWFRQRTVEGGDTEDLLRAMAASDLLSIGIPEALGGSGGGVVGCVAVMEAMCAHGVAPLMYSLTAFSREAILKHGSEDQIAKYVVPTMTGEERLSFGVTEPDSGTNAFAMSTKSRRRSDGGFVLNGQKCFISGAAASTRILVLAKDGDAPEGARGRFSVFVVDTTAPGVELVEMDIDWRAPEKQYSVFFTDVELGPDRIVGEPGEGLSYIFDALNSERVVIAAWALGLGEFALVKAVEYAQTRAPFGKPIGGYQAVQHPLALAKAQSEAARLLMYQAARKYDGGDTKGMGANMAKLLASKAALASVEAAIQTFGGAGFVRENDVIDLWPMLRVLQIAPLNNESILNSIGERVLGLPRSY